MSRPKGRRSISTTIVLAFTALIVAATVLVVFRSYAYTQSQLQSTATEYTGHLISQVNAEIDMYVEYIKDISDFVVRNPSVGTYVSGAPAAEQDAVTRRVQQLLNTTASVRHEISAIALISGDGRVLFGGSTARLNPYAEYQEASWYQGALAAPGEVYVSSSHVENLIQGQYPWVVSFSQAVPDRDGQSAGVLLVDLNYEVIDAICASVQMGRRGYIFLVDSGGEILWHPQQKLIHANLKTENVPEALSSASGVTELRTEEGSRLYLSTSSKATGWTTVGVAYPEELLQQTDLIVRQYILIAGMAILAAILLSILISRAITEPIRKLAATMETVERGDFSVRSQVSVNNEVGRLSESFNHMIATTQNLMAEQLRNEEQKRRDDWNLLQAQIKPHFIYNTLDSIIWMSHAGRNDEVVEMTSALAQLLRNSIGTGKDIIPLDEELAHVESYLKIQKMRYREKLRFEMDIDPETRQYLLPRLVLQPLVENAIYHGVKVKEHGGTVRVTSMLDEDKLLITVEDDGAGMTEEQLAHIYEEKESDDSSSKIGVYNVVQRLRIFFGPDYGLKFFSEPGKGTTAMLILPRMTEEP